MVGCPCNTGKLIEFGQRDLDPKWMDPVGFLKLNQVEPIWPTQFSGECPRRPMEGNQIETTLLGPRKGEPIYLGSSSHLVS